MGPENVTPSKRRTDEDTAWPNKRSGSASPFSSAPYGQGYSHAQSPPPDSSGFSSPRPPSRQYTSLPRQGNRPIFPPPDPDSDPDPGPDHDIDYEDTKILLQPETRPISQEQLVNEVKGIYAGLVMVEKKCVEICQQQAQTTNKLSNEQWQALIALHRTLLHEHHDFFLA